MCERLNWTIRAGISLYKSPSLPQYVHHCKFNSEQSPNQTIQISGGVNAQASGASPDSRTGLRSRRFLIQALVLDKTWQNWQNTARALLRYYWARYRIPECLDEVAISAVSYLRPYVAGIGSLLMSPQGKVYCSWENVAHFNVWYM